MSKARNVLKRLVFPVLSKWYERKNQRIQVYKNRGLQIQILPEVFHPAYFLSTNILLDFVLTKELNKKKILELGAGSGFISFYLAKNTEGEITATDINPKAIEGLKQNKENLQIQLEIIESDLFENVELSRFDFVLINPPYYPKNPESMRYAAFYCGEDFDYFKRLFQEIKTKRKESLIYMILSQDCEIELISQLAKHQELEMKEVFRIRKMGELNFIFEIY